MAFIALNCPNCKGKIEVDDCNEFATCMYCNSKILLNRPASNPSPTPPHPVHSVPAARKSKSTSGLLAVIIIIFLFFVGVNYLSDNNGNASINTARPLNTNTGNYVINAQNFISAAEKSGYTIIIEDDYDGFGTYWAGAHKFAEGVIPKEGNEIYVIDYTTDATIHNSKVEYNLYVTKVNEIGGNSNSGLGSGSGKDYQFQVNSSETRFGIAYRIGDVNLYVVADAEYKNEILAFFDAIGFGVEINE